MRGKIKFGSELVKKAGRPNLLNETLLKKVKDTGVRERAASGVKNTKQILNIAKGDVRANNPNALKKFGGSLHLTERWGRDVLKQLKWSKRKGTTSKVDPPPQFWLKRSSPFEKQYLRQF